MATSPSLAQLEIMTEAELESIILSEGTSKLGVDARYILGKNYIEGSFPEKVPRNEKKGISWIREAVNNDHILALEFKTYYDIRFEKHPSIDKILKSLEKVVEKTKSSRACATLAEFCHAKQEEAGNREKAAMYYKTAADQGDVVGLHWMGVYYMEGFGVAQDLNKSEQFLIKAQKVGNAQSAFQLYLLYSSMEGKKDIAKAYRYLNKAMTLGVTNFEQMNAFFRDNFDVLAPVFAEIRKPPQDMTSKQEILNLHDAYLSEL